MYKILVAEDSKPIARNIVNNIKSIDQAIQSY